MESTLCETTVLIGDKYVPALISDIKAAKVSVDVLMFDWRWYEFEPASAVQRINQALAQATLRGVQVRCLTNFAEIVGKLQAAKMKAKKFGSRQLLHSKIVVLDSRLVYIGSHNFTTNAFEYNYESSVRLLSADVGSYFRDYFERLWLL